MIGAQSFAVIALGGAVGACVRFALASLLLRATGPDFPWGTLAANVVGGLLIGALSVVAAGDRPAYLALGVGVLGGFTTFSAFSLETLLMIERGRAALAGVYAAASVAGAVLAAALGRAVTRAFV